MNVRKLIPALLLAAIGQAHAVETDWLGLTQWVAVRPSTLTVDSDKITVLVKKTIVGDPDFRRYELPTSVCRVGYGEMTVKYLNGVDDTHPDAVLGGGTDASAIAEWMCEQGTTVSSRSTPAASRPPRSTGASTTGGSLVTSPVASMADVPPPTTPDESQLLEHSHYKNRDGQEVHSPAHSMTGSVPAGATAQCRDGTFSFSQHRSGTCSHHGGVSQWIG